MGLESLFRFLLAPPSRSSSPLESDSEGELGDVGRLVDEALAWPLLPVWMSYSSSFVVFMMIVAFVQAVALLRSPKSRLRRGREMEKMKSKNKREKSGETSQPTPRVMAGELV